MPLDESPRKPGLRPPVESADPNDRPPDEKAIADALWRSLFVLAFLGTLAAGAIWWLSRAPVAPRQLTALGRPEVRRSEHLGEIPEVRFTEITRAAGIDFVHHNGATGEKLLPETMGGGVVAFDADGDGDTDLFFINGTDWTGAPGRSPPPTSMLYRNDTIRGGALQFTNVTRGSGLGISLYGMGAAAGDFDNDGRVDLYLYALGGNHLFHNLGPDPTGQPRFQDITGETGTGGFASDWSTAATWFDLDNDGDLDLFVGNYVGWRPELDREVNTQLTGVGRAYGRPWNFPGSVPRLYRNDGPAASGGMPRFTEIGAASGLQRRNPATGLPMAKTLGVAAVDLNSDGWMDLVVANDTVQNFVFTNRHNGTFQEVGDLMGVAFDAFGQARGAMGIDIARFRDDDPVLGIAIGNFANEMNALYVASSRQDQLVFADAAIAEGLGPESRQYLKFSLFFFDYDLDGRLDVLTANGHIEDEVAKVQTGVTYRQPAQLFWNAGGRKRGPTFVNVSPDKTGPDLFEPIVGRGSAYGDFDGDGDLDVVLTQVNGPPRLLRNDQKLNHHWCRLRLVGTRSNRDALGAWVTVRSGSRILSRQVMATKGYLSQSELPITIGLGSSGTLDEVTVSWPGGGVQRVGNVQLDGMTEIREVPR